GHCQRSGQADQPLPADHRADCHGGEPRRQEEVALHAGLHAGRHRDLWLLGVREHRDHRRAAVLARGRTGPPGRASGPAAVRRVRTHGGPFYEEVTLMAISLKPIPDIDITPPPPRPPRRTRRQALLAPELVRAAVKRSLVMLRPDIQWTNPVMFVVEVGAFLTLLFVVQAVVAGSASQVPVSYFIALDAWLFLTVLFANFATALAEARGKAQAESLRHTRRGTPAYRLRTNNTIEEISSAALRPGDRVVVQAGQIVPGDGEIIEGIASIDESAITGESASVIREAGGDRSGVTGGTLVLSDRIVVRITAQSGES